MQHYPLWTKKQKYTIHVECAPASFHAEESQERRGGGLNGNGNYTDSVGNLITTDTTLFLPHILGVQRIK